MIPSSVRNFVCTTPPDMRRSIDGLALAVRSGSAKIRGAARRSCFINKRAKRLKVLWFDQNGYCILYKRLHRAVFMPPMSTEEERPVARIDGAGLRRVLSGVERPKPLRIKWHGDT